MAAKKPMSKAADRKQDAKVTKGLSPKQKAAFKKIDSKMDKKPMTAKQDAKADRKAVKQIKKGK